MFVNAQVTYPTWIKLRRQQRGTPQRRAAARAEMEPKPPYVRCPSRLASLSTRGTPHDGGHRRRWQEARLAEETVAKLKPMVEIR